MRLVLVIAAAAALAGCAGDGPSTSDGAVTPGPTPAGGAVTIAQLEQQIFTPNCLGAGCHNAGDAGGSLVLEPGLAWRQLVGVATENVAAANAGWQRAVPFDLERSFLVHKLLPISGGFGARMPLSRPPLSEQDIELIRRWIREGAADRQGPSPTPLSTATATDVPTATITPSPSPSSTVTDTPTITATPSITATFTRTPTGTVPPSATATITPTASASATASATATVPVVSFAEIEQTIFRTSCAVQFCHDSVSGGFSGNLVLEPGRAYAELVNHAPDNPSAATMGFKRVVPGDTANSFLLLKVCDVIHSRDLCPTLLPLINPILGSRMPLVGPPISNEAVAAIHAWILRGAAESE